MFVSACFEAFPAVFFNNSESIVLIGVCRDRDNKWNLQLFVPDSFLFLHLLLLLLFFLLLPFLLLFISISYTHPPGNYSFNVAALRSALHRRSLRVTVSA